MKSYTRATLLPRNFSLALLATSFVIGLAGFVLSGGYLIPPGEAQAASVRSLQQQKARLQQQAKQAAYDALQQKSVAERAAARQADIAQQLNNLQASIQTTTDGINQNTQQITDINGQLADKQAELAKAQAQGDMLLREMYVNYVSQPDALAFFANQSISSRAQTQAQLDALQQAAATIAAKVKKEKSDIEATKASLEQKEHDLESLKSQQDAQVAGLAEMQQQQADLQSNAEAAQVAYEQKAHSMEVQTDQMERQIEAELAILVRASKPAPGGRMAGAVMGARVSRGTVVGHEGSTGNSTGPHVHFECRVNNVAVNCQPYVDSGTLVYPVTDFVISQRFGETANSAMYNGAPHMGTDLAGPYGQPVTAPADGTVILNKWYGGYGNAWAEQLDNGLVVLLGHMTGN